MEQRINPYVKGQAATTALYKMGAYLYRCSVDQHLLQLVEFRVSQMNGCAYCLDMHSKDLRAAGETEQRLYMMEAWRDASIYTDRERAAFAWAEAVTELRNKQVPDDVYEEAIRHFSDTELVDLTLCVIAINSYNRMNAAFKVPSGDYKVGMHAVAEN